MDRGIVCGARVALARSLLAGAAIGCLAGGASAQGSPAPSDPLQAQSSGALGISTESGNASATSSTQISTEAGQDVAAAPARPAETSAIGDIVVTAQRRSENLQRSALAVSVLSADALARAGATTAQALSRLVPGVQIGGAGAFTQIYIRGIGDRSSTFLSNASVTTNLNGVPLLRSTEVNGSFFDLQRIEILKGPQGTLYGRNATGGAINILPNRPTQEFGGYLNAEVGSFDLVKSEGALNVPLSPDLAVRGAFQIVDRDGYLSDGTSDDKQQNGRITALWKPGDAFTALLTGGYSHQGGKGGGLAVTYPLCTALTGCISKWTGITDPLANTIRLNNFPPSSTTLIAYPAAGYPVKLDNRVWYVTGQFDYDFGPATLTVLPSYHHDHYFANTYPGLVFGNDLVARQKSVEARLSHDGAALKWVAGFFYVHERQTGNNPVQQNVLGTGSAVYNLLTGSGASIDSKAGFAQATYSLTPALRVTGGIRYTDETSSLNEQLFACTPTVCPGAPTFSIDNRKVVTRKTTYKAGIDYDVAPDHFVYATYSTGFKAGGLYAAPIPDPTFRPETITAYEFGSRNRFAGGRLQVNLEVYRWDYRDQVYSFVGPAPGSTYVTLVFLNIGAGRVQGFSADVTARPWRGGTLRFATDYADSNYGRFTYEALAGQRGPANTTCPVGAVHPGATGLPVQTVDCSGRPFILAPKWSGSASIEQEFGLPSGAALDFSANANFTTSRYSQFEFLASELLPSTVVVDLDASYRAPSGKWSIGAYVHNIGNVATYSQSQSMTGTAGATAPAGGPVVAGTIGAPRTAGVRASVSF